MTERKTNRPTHRVYAVRKTGPDTSYWAEIGAAWANRDGQGFNLKLTLLPVGEADEHGRQEQVWESVNKSGYDEPYQIRRLLTERAVRASDKRARFVGLAAYEAAGGNVLRDLFEEDGGGWPTEPESVATHAGAARCRRLPSATSSVRTLSTRLMRRDVLKPACATSSFPVRRRI